MRKLVITTLLVAGMATYAQDAKVRSEKTKNGENQSRTTSTTIIEKIDC
jgi:hypothetical protein